MVMPEPTGAHAAKSMRNAIEGSGMSLRDVDAVNTHGTATIKGDVSEVLAMKEVFDGKPPPFSSTKSMTGHPLGAAGALETIFCVGMLEHRFIAPSINIEKLDPEFAGMPIVTTAKFTELHTILSNRFGPRRRTARDELCLRACQAAHQLEVLLFQAQRRIYPYVGDVEQLLIAHGVEMLAAAEHALHAIAAPLVAPDVVPHSRFPGPVFREHVDDARRVHFLGGVDTAGEYHLFGTSHPHASGEQAVGAVAGKQIEQDLGQAHPRASLGDNDVRRERCFESAAERLPLHQ